MNEFCPRCAPGTLQTENAYVKEGVDPGYDVGLLGLDVVFRIACLAENKVRRREIAVTVVELNACRFRCNQGEGRGSLLDKSHFTGP